MTEIERVKEFIEALAFHGYIDHDPEKLNKLIDDYYPVMYLETKEQRTNCIIHNTDVLGRCFKCGEQTI